MTIKFECRDMTDQEYKREQVAFDEHGQEFGNPPEISERYGFVATDTGYFVYCNGRTDREAFDGKLEFDVKLIPYVGDCGWIEQTIFDISHCLNSKVIPKSNPDCDYCQYVEAVGQVSQNSTITVESVTEA